ncbi:SDR family oxidoreductase [Nocardia flavorosea]|uniref:SDR family oxidoreductase n=1 Tax=Nocardia flavorosea TaxID=53429 RepID=A0A846YF93_9NOCA|nr:SDR family oxidoreductase [Nocardia flavorosea]
MSEADRATTGRRREARPSHRPGVQGQPKPGPETAGPGGRTRRVPAPGEHTAVDAYTAALPSFELSGRVAIVTGASSGLGAAVSRALAGLGAQVAVVARRRDRLDALAGEIGGIAAAGDLSEPAAIAEIIPDIAGRLGPPEILINAAGNRFGAERAESEPLDDIRRTLDLNLVAPLLLAQQVFPYMRELGRGSIVNISSISGRVGVPGIPQASYAASKAGLSGLTTELAVQWARHSIRVNTVAPGFFRSEITGSLYDSDRGAEYLRRNIPLPTEGTAEDMIGAIVWLAGDAGRYVTGQTVVVDGGWTAH